MIRAIAIACLLVGLAAAAGAEEKSLRGVALVIGQSDYEHLPDLPNPGNDARAIEDLLEDLGFEVDGTTDRDAKKLRRDLERFAEDAEDADAAIIYYSGHGIEAGGDNWLVPVDADLGALDDVGSNLVALSGILEELRAKVPLTIFLIDACRSNPFPPGAIARNSGEQMPISGSGLGIPRGFSTVEGAATDQIGTIIGFAAEPGLPALDGDPGTNSPYAAALVRHLSAMTGSEFGLVMRMVTEEVYLKTQTQQRPWVNESLRKQLFFGSPEALPEGPDGIITGERRKLLLTIASLPGPQRNQVEKIATANGVQLDTLYGILAALGESDMPKDEASLELALKGQAGRIKAIIEERKALASDDPEIKRLVAAADTAIAEGAIKSARGFLDEAKQVVEQSRGAIENVEAQARAKRIANAEVLVKSAETAEIDFDFGAAVTDYASAFDWVKDADPALAAKYKTYEADALQAIGAYRGDGEAMAKAVAAYEMALLMVGKQNNAVQWGKTTNNLANTYLRMGERELGTAALEKAASLYRDVLSVPMEPGREATTLSNLGIALHALAERNNDAALYAEAEKTFAAALASRDKTSDATGWAMDLLNAANLDVGLADRNGEPERLKAAEQRITEALARLDPAANRIEWAQAKNNLAITQRVQGANQRDPAKVRNALDTYQEILPVFNRKMFPVDWGNTIGNIAIAHTNIGALEGNVAEFETALGFYRLALEEVTRQRAPVFWARLQNSYGMTLQVVGTMKQDAALLEQSAEAFRNALTVRAKDINAAQWAESHQFLASALSSMASSKADVKLSDESIAAYRAAREVFTREFYASDWMSVSSGLAMALQGKGILTQDDQILMEAEAIYQEVLAATDRAKAPLDWASAMKDIATIQFMLGTTHQNKAEVKQSIRSFDLALEEYSKHGGFMDKMMIGAMRSNAVKALELFQ
jgi:uncharacterized caspase-like protein